MTECMLANMAHVDLKMVCRRHGHLHLDHASLCTSEGCIYIDGGSVRGLQWSEV